MLYIVWGFRHKLKIVCRFEVKWTLDNDSSQDIILYMYNWKEALLNSEPFM